MEIHRTKLENNMEKILISFLLTIIMLANAQVAWADTVTDNALNYLRTKQDASGRITTGFSAPSQWSAIAFAANGIDTSTIKNPTNSLKDFLVSDIPSEPSAPTDWETRILAIVAIGSDPSNFGVINFIQNLETFYNHNQIGDECSLNDDIFGLLALIAGGSLSNNQIEQNVLHFIISKQDSGDGGFGFSAPGCNWYSTSSDMTGAAIQALVAAKENGLTDPDLDNAIGRAKDYLLANQYLDGGFGYYGTSDPDSTGWALMAFNTLGMENSSQANSAHNYLLSQQSQTDGGIMAFDWGASTFVSNASTTAQVIIALAGKTWILNVFGPTSTTSATVTPSTSATPTVTPTPPSTTSEPTVTQTPTISLTAASTPTATTTPPTVKDATTNESLSEEILGAQSLEDSSQKDNNKSKPTKTTKSINATKGLLLLLSLISLSVAFWYWKKK